MFYVYVLLSLKSNQFYIGYTNNLKRRFAEHVLGNVVATKHRRPLKLIYYEAHVVKQDAVRRERYFKTTKGKISLRQMLRNALKSV